MIDSIATQTVAKAINPYLEKINTLETVITVAFILLTISTFLAVKWGMDVYIYKKNNCINLEAAKKGKPVCTRNGSKVRIICFDKVGVYPIIALVWKEKCEMCHFYSQDGKCIGYGNEYDLTMLSDEKEG